MKHILLFLLFILGVSNLNAYSYAAAGKELTIDSKEAILKAVNSKDFKGAKEAFIKYEKNYKYLNDEFNENLLEGLRVSIDKKNTKDIARWLDLSIASEIQRRLDGGLENIKKFNVAKVMLAKADKFYKILAVSLSKEQDAKLKVAIKSCIEAIGNPGLFGVGAKPINIEVYKKNQAIAIEVLKSL